MLVTLIALLSTSASAQLQIKQTVNLKNAHFVLVATTPAHGMLRDRMTLSLYQQGSTWVAALTGNYPNGVNNPYPSEDRSTSVSLTEQCPLPDSAPRFRGFICPKTGNALMHFEIFDNVEFEQWLARFKISGLSADFQISNPRSIKSTTHYRMSFADREY